MRAALLLTLFGATPLAAQTADRPLVITGVTVIPGTGAAAQPGQTVVIQGGRITAIGSAARRPPGGQVVDGRGKFLIAGLWDMHVHLANRPLLPGDTGQAGLERNREWAFPLLLSYGVTGVRDMAGDLGVLTGWRSLVRAGAILGPRLVVTGRKLGNKPVVPGAPWPIETDDDVRRSVQLLRTGGADFVKVDGLAARYLPALFDAAAKAGLPVAGHTALDLGAAGVAAAGQRSIEHLDGVILATSAREAAIRADALAEFGWWRRLLVRMGLSHPIEDFRRRYREMLASQSDERADSLITTFLQYQTWQVPTLTLLRDIRLIPPSETLAGAIARYAPPGGGEPTADVRWEGDTLLPHRLYRQEVHLLHQMMRRGMPILAGTDGPGGTRLPGASLLDELELLVDVGMSPAQALASATREPARFLGLLDSLGTVEPGKIADLVLLDANPLEQITNVRRIHGVVRAGRWLGPGALDSLRAVAAGLAGR